MKRDFQPSRVVRTEIDSGGLIRVNMITWITGTRIRPVVTGRRNAREPFTKGLSLKLRKKRAIINIIMIEGKISAPVTANAPGTP